MPPPRVGLDIGGVLSVRNAPGADGLSIYKAAWVGAYAFCLFFIIRYGPENLFVISRTNTGDWYTNHRGHQVEAWVVRFIRSLGLFDAGVPTNNVRLCTDRAGKRGKGPCAERFELTHMVDDHLECLWSVFEDPEGNSNANIKDNQGFLIHFTKEKEGGGWMTADLKPYVYVTQDFRQIARWLDCDPGDTIWNWLTWQ